MKNFLNKGDKEEVLIKHTFLLVLLFAINTIIFSNNLPVLYLTSCMLFGVWYCYIENKL